MTNFASWNMRGMNSPLRSIDIAMVIEEYKIGWIEMLETKIKEINFTCTRQKMGSRWSRESNYLRDNSGRILVAWDSDSFQVDKFAESKQAIHLKVNFIPQGINVYISIIYATNNPAKQTYLWQELLTIAPSISLQWICMGEF